MWKRCLFPQAITPLQKAACVGLGIVSFGATTVGVIKFFKTCDQENTPANRFMNSKAANRIGTLSLAGLTGTAGTMGLYTAGQQVINMRDILRNSTQCCHIARMAFVSTITIPGCTVLGIGLLGVSVIMLELTITGEGPDGKSIIVNKLFGK